MVVWGWVEGKAQAEEWGGVCVDLGVEWWVGGAIMMGDAV